MIEVLVSATFVFVVDHAVKRAAKARFGGEGVRVGPLFVLRHVPCRKRFFQNGTVLWLFAGTWIASVTATILLVSSGYFASPVSLAALGAAVGGAASNLYDVLDERLVHDYIDLGWWPVFNIADVAILGGLALAFLVR